MAKQSARDREEAAEDRARKALRRHGVDPWRVEAPASRAIAGPMWSAHPDMTGGEFLDCAPAIRPEWVGAEEAQVEVLLAVAVANPLPVDSELPARPWSAVYGPVHLSPT